MPEPTISTPPAPSRKERILAELMNIIHDLSGIDVADLDVNATFLELGFDSLFLTQANAEFRKKFNVKITFRQLLNEAPTLDALAQFIDSKLPAEAFPEETPQPCSVPELTLAKPAQQQASMVPPSLPEQGVAHDVTQPSGTGRSGTGISQCPRKGDQSAAPGDVAAARTVTQRRHRRSHIASTRRSTLWAFDSFRAGGQGGCFAAEQAGGDSAAAVPNRPESA